MNLLWSGFYLKVGHSCGLHWMTASKCQYAHMLFNYVAVLCFWQHHSIQIVSSPNVPITICESRFIEGQALNLTFPCSYCVYTSGALVVSRLFKSRTYELYCPLVCGFTECAPFQSPLPYDELTRISTCLYSVFFLSFLVSY